MRILFTAVRVGALISPLAPCTQGERDRVSGDEARCTTRELAPHPCPLPRVQGRGSRIPREPFMTRRVILSSLLAALIAPAFARAADEAPATWKTLHETWKGGTE